MAHIADAKCGLGKNIIMWEKKKRPLFREEFFCGPAVCRASVRRIFHTDLGVIGIPLIYGPVVDNQIAHGHIHTTYTTATPSHELRGSHYSRIPRKSTASATTGDPGLAHLGHLGEGVERLTIIIISTELFSFSWPVGCWCPWAMVTGESISSTLSQNINTLP